MAYESPLPSAAMAGEACGQGNGGCTMIPDRTFLTSDGEQIVPGYDQWGYNYQTHLFNGGYCDAYQNADWCQPYKDVTLIVKLST